MSALTNKSLSIVSREFSQRILCVVSRHLSKGPHAKGRVGWAGDRGSGVPEPHPVPSRNSRHSLCAGSAEKALSSE